MKLERSIFLLFEESQKNLLSAIERGGVQYRQASCLYWCIGPLTLETDRLASQLGKRHVRLLRF